MTHLRLHFLIDHLSVVFELNIVTLANLAKRLRSVELMSLLTSSPNRKAFPILGEIHLLRGKRLFEERTLEGFFLPDFLLLTHGRFPLLFELAVLPWGSFVGGNLEGRDLNVREVH